MAYYPQNTGVFIGPSTGALAPPLPGAGTGVPLTDYLRAMWARAVELPAVIPATASFLEGEPEDQFDRQSIAANQYAQQRLRDASNRVVQGMAPDTQRLLNASIASRDFWEQPFAWTALQTAGTVPDVAAAVVAGAVSGGTIPALVAAGAAGGALSAGDFLATAQRSVYERSDAQLKNDSVLYRDMREQGMPEDQARARMARQMTQYEAPILFALGLATNALGVPGQVLRAAGVAPVSRGVERGIAGRVARETGIGAGAEFVQSAGESLAAQSGAVTAGFQPDISISEALIAGASGALPGGVLGGLTGIPRDQEPQPPPRPTSAGGAGGAAAAAQTPPPPGRNGALPVGGGASRVPFPTGPAQPPPVVQAGPIKRGPLVVNRRGGQAASPTPAALAGADYVPPMGPEIAPLDPNAPPAPRFRPSRIGLPGAELGDENLGPATDRAPLPDPRAPGGGGALPVGRRPGMPPNYDPQRGIVATTGPSLEQRAALAEGQGLDLFGRPAGTPQPMGGLQGGLTMAPTPEPQPIQLPGPSLLPAPDAAQPELPIRPPRPRPTPPRPDAEQLPLPGMGPAQAAAPVSPGLTPIPRDRALTVPGAAQRPIPVMPTERTYPSAERPYPEPEPRQTSTLDFPRLVTFLLDRAGEDDEHFSFLLDYVSRLTDEELDAELARKRNTQDPHELLEMMAILTEHERLDQMRFRQQAGERRDVRATIPEEERRANKLRAKPRTIATPWGAMSVEAYAQVDAAMEEANRQYQENLFRTEQVDRTLTRDQQRVEVGPRAEDYEAVVAQYRRKDPAWVAQRLAEDERTVELFQKFNPPPTDEDFKDEWEPANVEVPQSPGQTQKEAQGRSLEANRKANLVRLDAILAEAAKRNIKPRGRVGMETVQPETRWLTEVRRLKKLLSSGSATAAMEDEIYNFYFNEREARQGNWAPLEESRREAGERMKGRTPSLDQEGAAETTGVSVVTPSGRRAPLPKKLQREPVEVPPLPLPPSPRLAATAKKLGAAEEVEPLVRSRGKGRPAVQRVMAVARTAGRRKRGENLKPGAILAEREVEVTPEEKARIERLQKEEIEAERRARAARGEPLPRRRAEEKVERPGIEEEAREKEPEAEGGPTRRLDVEVAAREGEAREEAPDVGAEEARMRIAPEFTPLADKVSDAIEVVTRVIGAIEKKAVKVGVERQEEIQESLPRARTALQLLRQGLYALEVDPTTGRQLRRTLKQLRGEDPLPMLGAARTLLGRVRNALPKNSVQGKALDGVIAEITSIGLRKGIRQASPAALRTRAKELRKQKQAELQAARAEAKARQSKAEAAPEKRTIEYLTEPYEHPRHKQLLKTPQGRAELRGRRDFYAGRTKNPLGGLQFGRAWQKGFNEARAEAALAAQFKAELAEKGPIKTGTTAALEAKQAGRELPSVREEREAREAKAKVLAEEAKIATERSPKQEAAGNYTKGHLVIEGLRISLEVARQQLRTLAGGLKARTRYPYGYFVGTKSTDGEQIDVWLGPHAFPGSVRLKRRPVSGVMPVTELALDTKQQFPVVVISQLDAFGRFDENKVMLGFANTEAALDAYAANFPTIGRSRILDYRPMTMAEFKRWLNSSNSRKPVAQAGKGGLYAGYLQRGRRSVLTGEEGLPGDEEQPVPLQPEIPATTYHDRIRQLGGRRVSFDQVRQMALGGYWKNQDLRTAVQRMFDNLTSYTEDVPVYLLDARQMAELTREGMFSENTPNIAGQYHPVEDVMVLWEGISQYSAESRSGKILHELAHPAFDRIVTTNQLIRNATIQVAEELQSALKALGAREDFYAFADIHEFVAEFVGNVSMKRRMAQIKASPSLKRFLRESGIRTPIRTLLDAMRRIFAKAFGLDQSRVNDSLLHAMFDIQGEMQRRMPGRTDKSYRSISDYEWQQERYTENIESTGPNYPFGWGRSGRRFGFPIRTDAITDFGGALKQHLPESLGGTARQGQTGVPWLVHFRSTDELAQLLKTIPDSKEAAAAARDISNGFEGRRVDADDFEREFEPVLAEFFALEKRWKGRQEWEDFVSLLHDETMYGVWADRSIAEQFSKQTMQNAQARNRHADLAARLNALPKELKAARKQAAKLYEDMQRRVRDAIGENRLTVLAGKGTTLGPDVLERILAGEETAHDIAALGQDVIDDIDAAHKVTTLTGPYYPFIRRGNWVVNARVKLKPPIAGLQGRLVAGTDNVFEFAGPRAKEHAEHYASIQELKSFARGIWVDRNTGSEYGRDADGKDVRISPSDTDAEHRYRVRVQNQHTEFFERRSEAQIRAKELEDDPQFTEVEGVEGTRYREEALDWRVADATRLKHTDFEAFLDRLKKNERFNAMPAHLQNAFVQQMRQAALQSLGATRLAMRLMPREYVQGMSREFTRNMADYAQATSSQLANFKHGLAIENAAKRLEKSTQGDSKVSSAAKRAIANELIARVRTSAVQQQPGLADGIIRRLAQLAFTYFLGSPSYTLNNLLQTTVTWTQLAGTYGPGVATSQFTKAYEDIAALQMLGTAMKATKERMLGRAGGDYFEQLIVGKNITNAEKTMLRRLRELGVLGSGTGIEIARMVAMPSDTLGGKADRALYWATEIAREFPRASEMINRSASALATFRAEMARNGGDIEAATLKAQEVTNLTQGLYSASDAAPIFNTKGGQLTLVFRKFGALMYGLLGHQIGRVIRNANPGDRAEALRSLGYLMAATTAMAGTLGLPTDVFKALLAGLRTAGITELTWTDVENWERELGAEFFGATGGELLTRGLPRLLGIDLSQRVGLEGLLFHGEPRTDEEYDVKAFLYDNIAGAPLSMTADMVTGANQLLNGNVVEAAQNLLPLKILRDAATAGQMMTEGKQTPAGYQVLPPSGFSPGLIRTLGYTPRAEAETTAARNYFFRSARRLEGTRNDFLHDWIKAKGSERSRLWLDIVEWNRGQEPGARLSRADLNDYKKRRKSEDAPFGMRLTDANRPIFEGLAGPYPSMAVH